MVPADVPTVISMAARPDGTHTRYSVDIPARWMLSCRLAVMALVLVQVRTSVWNQKTVSLDKF